VSDPQLFEPPEPVAPLRLTRHWTHANPREARALGFLVFGVDVWSQP
jgi:hypothetical protein